MSPSGTWKDAVDNTIFREKFEASDITAEALAVRLGWMNNSTGRGDSSRVKRRLGITEQFSKAGGRKVKSKTVRYNVAVELADALNIDYHEVGI